MRQSRPLLPLTLTLTLTLTLALAPMAGFRPIADASAAPSPPRKAAACEGQAALDKLDPRTPLPLLPRMADHQKQSMRDHLLAVQEIVGGAATGDFAQVAKAAARIGYTEEMGQMCRHLGAGAPGFTEQALAFHHSADGIAAAAKRNDQPAVLQALAATLQLCTSCHARFKQRVVDEAAFAKATGR
jgi:hypothetical protein